MALIKKMISGPAKDKRKPILRTFSWQIAAILVLVAGLFAYVSWQNTLENQENELRYLTRQATQGLQSHLGTHDLLLRSLGDELLYRDVYADPERGNNYLQRSLSSHSSLLGLAFLDPSGHFIAHSAAGLDLTGLAADDAGGGLEPFTEMRENPGFEVGRPYYLEPIEQWFIPLRAPVLDAQDELAGVMVGGLQLDGGKAPWASLDIDDSTTLAIVRDDGYLSYTYPHGSQERVERVYGNPVSDELQRFIQEVEGFKHYDRPYDTEGRTVPYYAYAQPLPEMGLTAVVMRSRETAQQAWLRSLMVPAGIWLFSILALGYGYSRASNLIYRSDRQVRETRGALEQSLSRYDKLTRSIPVGVYQLRGRESGYRAFDYISSRTLQLCGLPDNFPPDQILRTLYYKLLPDHREQFSVREAAAMRNLEAFMWQGQVEVMGEYRWFRVQAEPEREAATGDVIWHGVVIDITEQKRAQEQINALAFYDSLTKLPNRRLLKERLQEELPAIQQQEQFAALLSLDVDNFKALNDTLGTPQGDRALQAVAERIRLVSREQDVVARLGGDEFMVLMTGLPTDLQQAKAEVNQHIEHLVAIVKEPVQLHGKSLSLTVSVGVAFFADPDLSIERFLQQADQAMYQAKAAGRDTHVVFDAQMQESLTRKQELQRDLPRAIRQGELALHYQPQFNREKRIAGVEALIRWHHPKRGLIMPGEFIPLAEQSADIIALEDWVLQQACQQLAAWRQEPEKAQWVLAINISVRHLHASRFVDKIREALEYSGARADRLILEITESMLVMDTDEAIAKMRAIQELGVRFALDDFGTGYSSLSYLNELPVTELKIDRSFVAGIMGQDQSQREVIETIITLGKSMDMKLIAEGVETSEQLHWLQAAGCDYFQGFYFSTAIPVTDLNELITEWHVER